MTIERASANLTSGMYDDPGQGGDIDDERPSIRAVQDALRNIGAIAANEHPKPGLFDKITSSAVKRFQWYYENVPGYYHPGAGYRDRPTERLGVDGNAGPRTLRALATFVRLGYKVTGLLVKVDLSSIDRIAPNAGFSPLIEGEPSVGICDRTFASTLIQMGRVANECDVWVFVNQLFRVEGAPVSGAVVKPASFSAHKIGRAIDLQLGEAGIIRSGNPSPSNMIRQAEADSPFGKFRDKMKGSGCRYGGEFKISDPPHFDRQVMPPGSPEWKSIYFFNQLHFSQALKDSSAIPSFIKSL